MATANRLVEIRLKDWEPDLRCGTRIVAFEEVSATDEVGARLSGFDQFEARCNCDGFMRGRTEAWGLTPHNCCAPEAVQV